MLNDKFVSTDMTLCRVCMPMCATSVLTFDVQTDERGQLVGTQGNGGIVFKLNAPARFAPKASCERLPARLARRASRSCTVKRVSAENRRLFSFIQYGFIPPVRSGGDVTVLRNHCVVVFVNSLPVRWTSLPKPRKPNPV